MTLTDAQFKWLKWLHDNGGSAYVDQYGRCIANGKKTVHGSQTAWLHMFVKGVIAAKENRIVLTDYGRGYLEYGGKEKTAESADAIDTDDVRMIDLNVKARAGEPLMIEAAFQGEPVKIFAMSFVEWFRREKGDNFVTLSMIAPDTGEQFEITMQRCGGKSTAQTLSEMRQLLKDIYDADLSAAAELRKVGLPVDPKFQHRIESMLDLRTTQPTENES